MRPSWISAGFDQTTLLVNQHARRKPVAQLALASDLLEPVASRRQLLKHRSRKSIFNLDSRTAPAEVARISSHQEARRFDRLLHRHPAIDHAGDDGVGGRGNPGIAG